MPEKQTAQRTLSWREITGEPATKESLSEAYRKVHGEDYAWEPVAVAEEASEEVLVDEVSEEHDMTEEEKERAKKAEDKLALMSGDGGPSYLGAALGVAFAGTPLVSIPAAIVGGGIVGPYLRKKSKAFAKTEEAYGVTGLLGKPVLTGVAKAWEASKKPGDRYYEDDKAWDVAQAKLEARVKRAEASFVAAQPGRPTYAMSRYTPAQARQRRDSSLEVLNYFKGKRKEQEDARPVEMKRLQEAEEAGIKLSDEEIKKLTEELKYRGAIQHEANKKSYMTPKLLEIIEKTYFGDEGMENEDDLLLLLKRRPAVANDVNVQKYFARLLAEEYGYPVNKPDPRVIQLYLQQRRRDHLQAANDDPNGETVTLYGQATNGGKVVSRKRALNETQEQRNRREIRSLREVPSASSVLHALNTDMVPDEAKEAFKDKRGRIIFPLFRDARGVGIDITEWQKKTLPLYKRRIALQASLNGETISNSEEDAQAREVMELDIERVMGSNRGRMFIRHDERGLTETIINREELDKDVPYSAFEKYTEMLGVGIPWYGDSFWGRLMRPLRATWHGAEGVHYTLGGELGSSKEDQGMLEYIGQLAGTTPIAYMLEQNSLSEGLKAYMSPQNVESIRQGHDVLDQWENLGKIFTPKWLEREQTGSAAFESLIAAPAMLGALALEPDIFLGAGFVLKGIGKASRVSGLSTLIGRALHNNFNRQLLNLKALDRLLEPLEEMGELAGPMTNDEFRVNFAKWAAQAKRDDAIGVDLVLATLAATVTKHLVVPERKGITALDMILGALRAEKDLFEPLNKLTEALGKLDDDFIKATDLEKKAEIFRQRGEIAEDFFKLAQEYRLVFEKSSQITEQTGNAFKSLKAYEDNPAFKQTLEKITKGGKPSIEELRHFFDILRKEGPDEKALKKAYRDLNKARKAKLPEWWVELVSKHAKLMDKIASQPHTAQELEKAVRNSPEMQNIILGSSAKDATIDGAVKHMEDLRQAYVARRKHKDATKMGNLRKAGTKFFVMADYAAKHNIDTTIVGAKEFDYLLDADKMAERTASLQSRLEYTRSMREGYETLIQNSINNWARESRAGISLLIEAGERAKFASRTQRVMGKAWNTDADGKHVFDPAGARVALNTMFGEGVVDAYLKGFSGSIPPSPKMLGVPAADKIKLYEDLTYEEKVASDEEWLDLFARLPDIGHGSRSARQMAIEMIQDPRKYQIQPGDRRILEEIIDDFPDSLPVTIGADGSKGYIVDPVSGKQRYISNNYNGFMSGHYPTFIGLRFPHEEKFVARQLTKEHMPASAWYRPVDPLTYEYIAHGLQGRTFTHELLHAVTIYRIKAAMEAIGQFGDAGALGKVVHLARGGRILGAADSTTGAFKIKITQELLNSVKDMVAINDELSTFWKLYQADLTLKTAETAKAFFEHFGHAPPVLSPKEISYVKLFIKYGEHAAGTQGDERLVEVITWALTSPQLQGAMAKIQLPPHPDIKVGRVGGAKKTITDPDRFAGRSVWDKFSATMARVIGMDEGKALSEFDKTAMSRALDASSRLIKTTRDHPFAPKVEAPNIPTGSGQDLHRLLSGDKSVMDLDPSSQQEMFMRIVDDLEDFDALVPEAEFAAVYLHTVADYDHKVSRLFGGKLRQTIEGVARKTESMFNTWMPWRDNLGALHRPLMARLVKQFVEHIGAMDQEFAAATKGLSGTELDNAIHQWLTAQESYIIKDMGEKVRRMNFPTATTVGPDYHLLKAVRNIISESRVYDEAGKVKVKLVDGKPTTGLDISATRTLQAISRAWLPDLEKYSAEVGTELDEKTLQLLEKMQKRYRETGVDMSWDELVEGVKDITKKVAKPEVNRLRGEIISAAEDSKKAAAELPASTGSGVKARTYMAKALIEASALDDVAQSAARHYVGLTDEVVSDMGKWIDGDYHKIKDPAGVIAAFARVGNPVSQRESRELGKEIMGLVRLSEDGGEKSIFVPKVLVNNLRGRLNVVVKSLEVHASNAPKGLIRTVLDGLVHGMRMFRQSVTLGLWGVPNPTYWYNNVVGDFTQMWQEEGLRRAARLSFQNLPANFGTRFHDAILEMSLKHKDKPLLGTAFNAVFNPNLHKLFNSTGDELIEMAVGPPVRADVVRRWMSRDGVWDTFVSENLLNGLRTQTRLNSQKVFGSEETLELLGGAKGKGGEAAEIAGGFADGLKTQDPAWSRLVHQLKAMAKGRDQGSEALARHATWVQQRQRAGLYLDILSNGGSRKQATEALNRALYDWKTPLGEGEIRGFAQLFTFFQFYRLSFGQSIKALMRGDWQALSRVRRMEQMLDMPREFLDSLYDRGEERADTMSELEDAFKSDTLAWWDTGTRATFFSSPTPEFVRKEYERRGMGRYEYITYMSPPATPLDSFNTLIAVAYALTLMTTPGKAAVQALRGEGQAATTAVQQGLIAPLSALMAPGLAPTVELALGSLTGHAAFRGGQIKHLTEGEERLIAGLDAAGIHIPVERKGGSQRPYITGWNVVLLNLARVTPFLGTQLPRYAAAVGNPYWQQDFVSGFSVMMLRLMGAGPRGHDVSSGRKYAVKTRQQQLAGTQKSLRGSSEDLYFRLKQQEESE